MVLASPIAFLVLVVCGVVVLGSILVAGREFHTAYRVFSAPTGRVSDLLTDSEGAIELHGTARTTDGTVPGPVTGTECLLAEVVVEEYESNQHGGSWTEVDSATRSRPFVLADDSGSVLVDPRAANVRLGRDVEEVRVDGGTAPSEQIRRYIEDNDDLSSENTHLDVGPLSLSTGTDRRYTERRLRPGGAVYVLGRARPESGRAGSVNAVVGADVESGTRLLVSDRSPRATGLRALGRGGLYLVPGALVAGICLLVFVA
ncbi:GIDE domain-containing protein [Halalkalicoccus jeotgali]|uniref:RING-type E3 ubiquitin transferase n=1 Tax=Halalkalicoccus jeotgali (strain DSM 18796 / CECT 7217 / JCM 14584 / KCTC 4019 / B3) TaxID=795797 RepID=D8JA84_HALJB|nr:GIDE domain-containing protein [Halalkalicoccus jeotgali]ADJ14606.1 hypothetical protein HacjB3_06075 [Halalkalicoccus jeotgali B3]ELY39979.1 hypothetical protein C497_04462 [Halalkalicoccus jeotgali B3]